MLKVTLNKIVPRAYATNFNVPGHVRPVPEGVSGRAGQVSVSRPGQDATEFLPGVVLPLRPFPGTIGVARKEPGRYSSVPPGEYAGNMDIRDLVEGTTLYVPVHVPGALLWTGDSHAGQGNGEVNLTAIETAYKEFNITVEVVKGKPLDFPRIETPKSWITMGFDQDLNKAWDQAKAQTVKFLSEQRRVSAEQAAKLMPTVSDCRVSQVVNIKKGIHCLNPKNASDKEDMERPTTETREVLRHPRQGCRPQQGDERRVDGHDQVAGEREEDRAARRLWARQRGDGLPRRRDLRHREERPLPDAEEPLGASAASDERADRSPGRFAHGDAGWTCSSPALLRRAARVVARAGAQSIAASGCAIVTTTTDLRSLAEAVGGDRVGVTSLVPPNLDPEEYQPKPQDVARLKDARLVVRVGLDFDLWFDRLLAQAGDTRDQARRRRLCRCILCHRGARYARRQRRSRRRPCPRQRQPALLARSEERRDHHRQHPRSAGARSIRPTRSL